MTSRDHLVEQHILEYQARLKHVDEVIAESDGHHNADLENIESSQLLESLKLDREELDKHIREVREQKSVEAAEAMIAKISPLDIWNKIAEKLEKLAEKIDR